MRTRKKMLIVSVVAVAALFAVSVAFASWLASGTVNGYAKAQTAQNLTTTVATPTATLYPGATGDVSIVIVNPNPYDVIVTDVVGSGAIVTTPTDAACDASTGVTFTDQHALTLAVPANSAGTAFTLTGSVAMSNASVNACQGETFAIPVTLTGDSDA